MAGSAWVIADMVMHFIGRIWCFLWNVFMRDKGKALLGLIQSWSDSYNQNYRNNSILFLSHSCFTQQIVTEETKESMAEKM